MDTAFHRLQDLFRQLGLADDRAAIDQFIATHGPLPVGMAVHEAPCWTPSQAQFLREAIAADADWAEVVDMLATRLGAGSQRPSAPRLLVLAGSARQGALSGQLARAAAELARQAGCTVTVFDAATLRLPVYDGDLEASSGVPAGALQLQDALLASDGLLLVTPEYNGFPTPLLLNAFDWLSRIPASGTRPAGLAATADRPVALLASSPGPGGALRSMNFLRQYLQMAFQMVVVPQQFALGKAHEAFDEAGGLRDAKAAQAVAGVLQRLAVLARALRPANRPG